MYTVVPGKPGAQEYYNSLFELYASWGLDFVKIDDIVVNTGSTPVKLHLPTNMIKINKVD
jgi:hypothetical protein